MVHFILLWSKTLYAKLLEWISFFKDRHKECLVKVKVHEAQKKNIVLVDVFYHILSKAVLQYLNEEIQPILSGDENKKSPAARPSEAKELL